MGAAADAAYPHSGESEDVVHFFQPCPRVSNLWDILYVKLVFLVPDLSSDWDMLLLAFLVCSAAVERRVVAHLGVLVGEMWDAGSFLHPPSRADLAVSFKAHFPALKPLF